MAREYQWKSLHFVGRPREAGQGDVQLWVSLGTPQPIVIVCSGSFGQVLRTAHPSIQPTTKAILPEEEIDIPSQKSPMELERNERPWLIKDVPESA